MSTLPEDRLRLARAARESAGDTLAPLLARLNEKQRKAVENAAPRWQLRYARVMTGDEGKAQAMRVACAACVGFEQVEAAVGGCLAMTCPLWLHRPYQPGVAEAELDDAEVPK